MTKPIQDQSSTNSGKPVYEPPRITTFTSEEILEQVGPALTCSPTENPYPV
jgi:hypothetical protein